MLNKASGRQIAKGASWLLLFKMSDRCLGLISTVVLARLLTPADFGLVAMASAVVALIELMGAFGFDSALIQRQELRREHYDTVWTLNLIFGIAIAILLAALAVPAALFYREARLEFILPVLAIGSLVGGLENVGTVSFRKELDFKSEFRFLLAKRFSSFIVTLVLALSFRTYWALVVGVVVSKFFGVLISYHLHPHRPRFTLAARSDLFHFSKWIFISTLIQFLHNRSTDFILGRTVGSHSLGIYNIAAEIASTPSTQLIAPINRAVYPAYARLSNDLEELWDRFMQVFGIICLIAFPVAVGLACVADPVIRLVLGDQWLEAVPIIQIIALCGLGGALQSNLYVVIVALGKPKANTYLSATLLAISLPVVATASLYFGVLGAAYAHLGAAILGLVGIVYVFSRITGMSVQSLIVVVWRPALGSAIMAVTIFTANSLFDSKIPGVTIFLRVIALIIVGSASYISAVLLLWVLSGRPTSAEQSILVGVNRQFRAWRRCTPGKVEL
jgi:lipopolysaccharide exporter